MRPRCLHFKLAAFVGPGETYHFARTELTDANAALTHDHDFHEIFWTVRGRGEHRLNGRTIPLAAGQLMLVRPDDRHCVVGSAAAPLQIVNLAFPSQAWRTVRRRYFARERDWFARPAARRMWPVDAHAQAGLAFWAERLAATGRPQVGLDGFLMELPRLLRAPGPGAELAPEWLLRARREIARPEQFVGGTPAFARLARRSPSHVARAAVRWLKETPTQVVNTARMDYSARQLTETSRPILDIMLDCGFNNLSHFYALFRRRFGVSPRRYRLRAHPTVRG